MTPPSLTVGGTMETHLLKHLESGRERMIRDLRGFVKIPSLSEDKEQVKAALGYYLTRAREMGFRAQSLLDDTVGVVEWGEGTETIGVLVHADVVGPGDLSKWPCDPFEGRIEGDRLFGRGTIDDKGPAISVLYALEALKSIGLRARKTIRIIIGTQEETEWSDIERYTASYPLPDYGFTPDGEFPITNREKGYVDIEISFQKSEREPENGYRLVDLSGGHGSNSVPDRAAALVQGPHGALSRLRERCKNISYIETEAAEEGMRLSAKGRSAHSSVPGSGLNAIERLCEVLACESFVPSCMSEAVRFIDTHKEDPHGRKWGLHRVEDIVDGLFFDHTTIVPTRVKTEAGRATVTYNLRTAPPVNRSQIEHAAEKALTGYHASFCLTDYKDPLRVDPKYPFLEIMAKTYEEVSGLPNTYTLARGTSYAKAMPRFVCWGPLFPGDPDTCHEVGESLSISQWIKATKIYTLALARMVSSEKPLR